MLNSVLLQKIFGIPNVVGRFRSYIQDGVSKKIFATEPENKYAWKVAFEDSNVNHSIVETKNSHVVDKGHGDPEELLDDYAAKSLFSQSQETKTNVKSTRST